MGFKNPVTPEILEAATQAAVESTRKAMDDHGHGLESLLKDLKRERNWKETKTMKVKGVVDPATLPKGHRIIAVSGVPLLDAEGNAVLDGQGSPIMKDGETVIQWQEKAGGIRQKARMDAHDLRGDYPATGTKSGVNINLNRPLTPEEEAALAEEFTGKPIQPTPGASSSLGSPEGPGTTANPAPPPTE